MEDWKPDSNIKFGWDAKIKSMQEDLSSIKWVGSWISCSSQKWDVKPLILVSSPAVLPTRCHAFLCALESRRKTRKIKCGFMRATESRLNSRLPTNDSNSFFVWLRDLYKEVKLQALSTNFKWRKCLDIGGHGGALFTDLSKAFDFIDHELLIPRLHAYGFENDALKFIYSYLEERKQRTKINFSNSSFAEILFGVPQGSILGPLLFNAYICDLFYDIDDLDFASFADDNTSYSCLSDMISVLGQLKRGIDKIFDWFKKKFLNGNAKKCHLITSSKTPVGIEVANMTIMSEETV